MESGEGIESTKIPATMEIEVGLWNPVKELKVFFGNTIGTFSSSKWNPVKELKDRLRSDDKLPEICWWNPVKELKAPYASSGPDEGDLKWNPVKELKELHLNDLCYRLPKTSGIR